MNKNITINMIAEELGLSRNTVSKALNNQHVSESTKKLIIDKAEELGYKGYGLYRERKELNTLKILLLAGKPIYDLDFFISFARGVERTDTKYNIEIFQYTFGTNTTFKQLGDYLDSLKIDGIIGIELYSKDLLEYILKTKIPTVFIDASIDLKHKNGNFDVLLMESRDSIYKLCNYLIANGFNRLTFCGDRDHCIGFNERFLGMRDSLSDIGHRIDMEQQLLLPDDSPFGDISWMTKQISALKYKPQAFICANDSIASSVINALKTLNYKIPHEVQVIGFDNTIESTISIPPITTVNVDKELLGQEALYLLVDRINRPNSAIKTIYIDTNIIFRQSTKK